MLAPVDGNPPLSKTPTQHAPPGVRAKLHTYMTLTAGNHFDWNYAEQRPLVVPPVLAHGVMADCSFGCVVLCKWAGAPDPTGNHFNGYGNSSSMYARLPHITIEEARVGDFAVFGPDGEWHAVMVYTPSPSNPVFWSHGHQGAPNLYPLSADKRRPVTFLRNPIP